MSRATILQLISAVIFVAVMFVIGKVWWFAIGQMSEDFGDGFLVGAGVVCVAVLIGSWMDRSATFGRRGKQGPRDSVDL